MSAQKISSNCMEIIGHECYAMVSTTGVRATFLIVRFRHPDGRIFVCNKIVKWP